MSIELKNLDADKRISVIYILDERLDAHNAPQMQNEIDEHTAEEGQYLIINMKNLQYISSGGIRIMIRAVKNVRSKGGEMYLSNLQQDVMDVFAMVGFDALFNIYKTEEEALKAIKG
jgi:anti-sigma B factor antagonist